MIGRRSVSARTGASSGVLAWALMLFVIWGVVPTAGAFALSVVSVVVVKAAKFLTDEGATDGDVQKMLRH